MAIFEKINTGSPQKHGNIVVGGPKAPIYGDDTFSYESTDNNFHNEYSESAIYDYNVVLANGVESSIVVPNGTTKIEFQNRENAVIYWSFIEGNAVNQTDPYKTLKSSDAYYQEYDPLYNTILYLSSDSAGVAEITFIK